MLEKDNNHIDSNEGIFMVKERLEELSETDNVSNGKSIELL